MITDEPPAATSAELSPIETAKLENLEIVIEAGLQSFLDVGRALLQIRDERLYRLTHTTFESYSHKRWGMTPQHANRLATAATIVESLEPIGSIPQTESQVRPLAKLPEDQRAEAWQEAVEVSGGKPTAAVVAKVVAKRRPATITRFEKFGEPAGACTHGGDHQWIEGRGDPFCGKCKSPKAALAKPEITVDLSVGDVQQISGDAFTIDPFCPRGEWHDWKSDDGEPYCTACAEPSYKLSDLMLMLQKKLRKLVAQFPREHRAALGHRLVSAGQELIETGGIR